MKTYKKNSSSYNYSQQFQDIKLEKERENLNFQSQNNEKYNLSFKLSELKNSLDKSNDTTNDTKYGALENFMRTGIKQSLFLFPNWERIRRSQRIIDR